MPRRGRSHGGFDPRLERGREDRAVPAIGVTHHRDPPAIDKVERLQVVDGPHRVPRVFSMDGPVRVLLVEAGRVVRGVARVNPLAIAEIIGREGDQACLDDIQCETHVPYGRRSGASAREADGDILAGARRRTVKADDGRETLGCWSINPLEGVERSLAGSLRDEEPHGHAVSRLDSNRNLAADVAATVLFGDHLRIERDGLCRKRA